MNTVTVVGNLTRDPELRYTPTGQVSHPMSSRRMSGTNFATAHGTWQAHSFVPDLFQPIVQFPARCPHSMVVSPRNTL